MTKQEFDELLGQIQGLTRDLFITQNGAIRLIIGEQLQKRKEELWKHVR